MEASEFCHPENKNGLTPNRGKSVFSFLKSPHLGRFRGVYSSNNISIIVTAAFATGLPGPKIAATPAL